MKYIIILFTFISTISIAQTNAIVHYQYKGYGGYKTTSTLSVLKGNYWYSRHQEPNTTTTEQGFTIKNYKRYKDWYYRHIDKTITQVVDKGDKFLFFGQWKADMKWEITEERKKIGNFTCQKATTKPLIETIIMVPVKKSVAWFTTDIPISAGPEGYYGLPGIIVKLEYEVEDPNNHRKTKITSVKSATLTKIEYKPVQEWDTPNAKGKITIEKDQFTNLIKINRKWLKEQTKLLQEKNKNE